jgi:transposase
MHEMGAKRARPPDGSATAIRAAGNEVCAKPTGRVYTAEYKHRVLRELEELRVAGDRGAIGAFLRREGLYSATVMKWARARDTAEKRALAPAKRGRKRTRDPVAEENERLRKENEKLHKELRKAEIIIDVQKKLAALLGIEVPEVPDPEKDGTP